MVVERVFHGMNYEDDKKSVVGLLRNKAQHEKAWSRELAAGLKFRDKPDGTGSVRSPVRLESQSYLNRS